MKPSVLISRLAVLFVAGISAVSSQTLELATGRAAADAGHGSGVRRRHARAQALLAAGRHAGQAVGRRAHAREPGGHSTSTRRAGCSSPRPIAIAPACSISATTWACSSSISPRARIEDRAALHHKVFGAQAKDFAIEGEVVRLVEDTNGDGVADKIQRLRRRLQHRARRHRLGRARAPRQGVVHQHPEPVAARGRRRRQGEEGPSCCAASACASTSPATISTAWRWATTARSTTRSATAART